MKLRDLFMPRFFSKRQKFNLDGDWNSLCLEYNDYGYFPVGCSLCGRIDESALKDLNLRMASAILSWRDEWDWGVEHLPTESQVPISEHRIKLYEIADILKSRGMS